MELRMKQNKISHAHSTYLWIALIVIVGLALRAAVIVAFHDRPVEGDELAYTSMALNLVTGNGVIDHLGNYAFYNVGYPLFVLAPIFFLFGENLLAVRLVNMVLSGVSITLCYYVAKEAGAGRLGRLLAPAIWVFYLPAIVYVVYFLKENLMIPLVLGVMWCSLRLLKEPKLKTALACGILFGLLSLTGNAALSMTISTVLALILAPTTYQQKLKLSVIILALAVTVPLPWMYRNMQVLGSPVLNTNSGFNFYLGNNPTATGWFISIDNTPRGSTWNELRKTGEVQASETLKSDAIDWIKNNPTRFILLAFKKLFFFLTPPFHEGPSNNIFRVLWAIQFIVMFAAMLGSLFLPSMRNRQLSLLWLGIICYMSVHMLFLVIFRYREPIMPFVGIVGALTAEALYLKGVST
jgi:4-amino-4-deoxy-L-arabinose transferase-like glycosyltransferase